MPNDSTVIKHEPTAIDHMERYKRYGRSPEGLKRWAKAILNRPELRCGYSECVLETAAAEMQQLLDALVAVEVLTRGTISTHVHSVAADAIERHQANVAALNQPS